MSTFIAYFVWSALMIGPFAYHAIRARRQSKLPLALSRRFHASGRREQSYGG